jgi:hypothetical protein
LQQREYPKNHPYRKERGGNHTNSPEIQVYPRNKLTHMPVHHDPLLMKIF